MRTTGNTRRCFDPFAFWDGMTNSIGNKRCVISVTVLHFCSKTTTKGGAPSPLPFDPHQHQRGEIGAD